MADYAFASIIDTPDITLPAGRYVTISYEYFWGVLPRHRTWHRRMPVQMHARDVIKMIERRIQIAYRRYQSLLGGDLPRLDNLNLTISSTTE
jgi:hypothetical protein